MALQPMSATKRRNVSPTTSTLNMLVEDVDCSGMAAKPEDGQFVLAVGGTATHDTTNLANDAVESLNPLGAGLRMVWGSALRSDRSALGDSRVPVIRKGGGRFKTKLFLNDDGVANLDEYAEGAALSVAVPAAAIEGSTDRLVLCPAASATSLDFVWVVGYVIRVINASTVSGTGEIEFYLYDQPRMQQINAE